MLKFYKKVLTLIDIDLLSHQVVRLFQSKKHQDSKYSNKSTLTLSLVSAYLFEDPSLRPIDCMGSDQRVLDFFREFFTLFGIL